MSTTLIRRRQCAAPWTRLATVKVFVQRQVRTVQLQNLTSVDAVFANFIPRKRDSAFVLSCGTTANVRLQNIVIRSPSAVNSAAPPVNNKRCWP